MANEIQLDIVTPLKGIFSGKVLQVVLPAWAGEEGVLPDHDDKLALVRGGVCTVYLPGSERRFAIGRGFAEMGDDHVTLLTDSCEESTVIQRDAARKELQDAEAELARVDWTSEEANTLRARIEVAQARLDA